MSISIIYTPIPHTHLNARFRELKSPHLGDNGEFTHFCLSCETPTGFSYESSCVEAGCLTWVVECDSCQSVREQRIRD